jgi:RimJ/RimL family protein N-acetyltransferase
MNLMIDNEEGTPIGTIQLYDFNEQDKCCKLGIRIGDKDYWGKGYGEDAVNTLLEYAFMKIDIFRVTLKVYEYNERAVKCYLKCGFQYEGRTRQSAYIDGKFYDEIIMGALKSDLVKKKED